MKYSAAYLKGYFKLLAKYIKYDLKILFYILLILAAVFFYISLLLYSETRKILEEYGGFKEIQTTTAIEPTYNGISQIELQILLEIINEYEMERINEIWLNFQPLTTVGIQCIEEPLALGYEIEGRNFTETEFLTGDKVVILSLEDYKCYYSDYHIGDMIPLGKKDFKLIGISNAIVQSLIPFNCIYNNDLDDTFICGHLVLKTKYPINKSMLLKRYEHQTQINQSDMPFVITPIFWKAIEDIYNKMLDHIISIILILVFCCLAIIQTCQILYYKNIKHQTVFLYAGFSKFFLKLIIGGEIFAIISISIVLSRILLQGALLCGN